MQRLPGASHLSGRDVVILEGLDRAKALHNSSFNFQESFTFSILLQLTTPYELNFAILTKGLLDQYGNGKIGIESVNGQLRVWLHDANNTTSLVVQTTNNIINTNEIFHLVISWNYTAKELKIYKNAVDQPYTILTGANRHSTISAMGLLRNNTSDLWIGAATGKNGAKIKMFGHLALVQRVWSSTEVLSIYNTIKYTGTYANQPKMLFSSRRGAATYNSLYIMNEDGTNQSLLYDGGKNITHPRWSLSGDYISFNHVDSGSPMTSPNDRNAPSSIRYVDKLGTPSSLNIVPNSDDISPSGSLQSALIIDGTTQRLYFIKDSSGTPGIYYAPFPAVTGSPVVIGSDNASESLQIVPSYNEDYIYLLYWHVSWSLAAINRYNYGGGGGVSLKAEVTSEFRYLNLTINRQNNLLAYAYRPNGSSPYNIYTLNLTGTSTNQITAEVSNSCIAPVFSWDGTKVYYNKQVGGVWQIWRCNINGTGHENISQSSYNEFTGDSFLF